MRRIDPSSVDVVANSADLESKSLLLYLKWTRPGLVIYVVELMRIVNIHEAKTHFSKIVDSVIHGNEVIIAMAGKPVAKIGPITSKQERRFGVLKGKIRIARDFDEPLPDDYLSE